MDRSSSIVFPCQHHFASDPYLCITTTEVWDRTVEPANRYCFHVRDQRMAFWDSVTI